MTLNEIYRLNDTQEIVELLTQELHFDHVVETELLQKILDYTFYAINESSSLIVTKNDGEILYINDTFCKLTNYKKEEIIGEHQSVLLSSFHPKRFFDSVNEHIQDGETWNGQIQSCTKDGNVIWFQSTIVPLKNKAGEIKLVIAICSNITASKQLEKQFKTNFVKTFQNLQNGIFKVKKDIEDNILYLMSEGRLMELIGAKTEQIFMRTPFEVFDLEVANIKNGYYLKAFKGERVQYEVEINGVLINVQLEPIEENGQVIEVVGTVHDFSAFRDIKKQLQVNHEHYQSLIYHSHEFILTLNREGRVIHMNPKTMELFGVDEQQLGVDNLFEQANADATAKVMAHFEKALRGEVQFFEFEIKNKVEQTFLNVTFIPIFVDGEVDAVNAIGNDITEEKLTQQRNAFLANHDELTNIPNRRWMENQIQQFINRQQLFTLLALDLDRFKKINDTLGHFTGDELLRQISQRLQSEVCTNSIHVARMGGDEFMILCTGHISEKDAKNIAKSILKSFEQPFNVSGFELFVTASIGVLFKSQYTNITEVMKQVDVALYKSKELGRNMYQIYDISMKTENYQQFVLERDLRKAVLNEEFVAHFQPKVDARTGETIGAEALIRWQHPKRGLIYPGEFINIAEETGLIIPIGKWMKRKVCETLVEWREMGKPLVPISINITSQRFLQRNFTEDLRKLFAEFQLDGRWIEIEITENSIMRNESIVEKTFEDLKEMGVKVFIDDFGIGYSSFNYLKTFAIDGVKIDRSFIHNIYQKPENKSITSAMIKMAQLLNLEVVAEGVETEEELHFLIEENCHSVQGFYFGKPCSIEQFEQRFLINVSEQFK